MGDVITIDYESRKQAVLQKKIDQKINAAKGKIEQHLTRLENEGNIMQDYIVPLGENKNVNFSSNGSLKMNFNDTEFSMHENAIGQTAERFGIPQGYLKSLALSNEPWAKDVATHILNEHSANTTRQRVLVRSVGNQIRGVLSDHYRRLDTIAIYKRFFSAMQSTGAVLIDAYAGDTVTVIDSILPKVIPVPTVNNGVVYMVFGIRMRNSDFGNGALTVQAYSINCVCSNGMTRENLMRQIHLGKRLPDNIVLSEETYRLDTQAQASIVEDVVNNAYSSSHIESQAVAIQEASEVFIDLDTEIKRLPKAGLLKSETEEVAKRIMNNNEDDGVSGGNTLWKLSQAITAVARDNDNEERGREIEDIAGRLLERVKL